MRILSQYETLYDADSVSEMLKVRGIATYISGKHEEWAGSFSNGPAGAALWVVLDEQYEDAMQLLNDPDHKVKTALSAGDIRSLESSMRCSKKMAWLPTWVKLVIVAALILVIGIWIKYPHLSGAYWP